MYFKKISIIRGTRGFFSRFVDALFPINRKEKRKFARALSKHLHEFNFASYSTE